ncbi:MAG: UDP-N-acetylmuramate--L-alanine ligase [Pseudomonadota bacterium]|nr:UDP-N-acetylmuramate--L-alanine ligase [Pseudomonadota bacterium]
MKGLPLDVGTIHFVGIGGIGMSGIAETLHNLGYSVQGSDIANSGNTRRLRALGVKIQITHNAANINGAQVVVTSSALKPNNPEVLEARSQFIPVVPRAEMLAELMRLKWGIAVAGTHGKTTTTSIIAALLDAGNFDPTVINGGIINAYGTNARLGDGDWIVVEADESDGSFTKLPATIAVVTNISPEHLDHFGDFETLKSEFVNFVQNTPFYGFATVCIDDTEVQALLPKITDRRIITYGLSAQADIRAIDITSDPNASCFKIISSDRMADKDTYLGQFKIPMVGIHNIRNALAAVTIALEMGVEPDSLRDALANFTGVKRRFTRTGVVNNITIIDDYGHHPVEISAVLEAAQSSANGKVIAVLQPHRYSRLRDLFEEFCKCFSDADNVLIADVYAAGESPLEGINRDTLIEGLRSHGHHNVLPLDDPSALPSLIKEIAKPGDFVVCLGAGNITNWANDLPHQLQSMGANVNTSGANGAKNGRC